MAIKQEVRCAALHDGPMEETLCARRRQERQHTSGAGGLTEDGDVVRVAAECGDVVAHPVQGCDLVDDSGVGHRSVVIEDEEAECPDAVVDGDDDGVGGGAQPGSVVHRERTGAQ